MSSTASIFRVCLGPEGRGSGLAVPKCHLSITDDIREGRNLSSAPLCELHSSHCQLLSTWCWQCGLHKSFWKNFCYWTTRGCVEGHGQQFHLGRVTLWCVIICKGGPFFFEDEDRIFTIIFKHHRMNEWMSEDSDFYKTVLSPPLELCHAHPCFISNRLVPVAC